MATTYEDIYQKFLSIGFYNNAFLPSTDPKIYEFIRAGLNHFNVRMIAEDEAWEEIIGDDNTESVNRDLTDNEILIIAHYLLLSYYEQALTYTATVLIPFSKEIGTKNVGNQLVSMRDLIANQRKIIAQLIFNSLETEIM